MYEKGIEILKILKENNYEGYIIGGYPRDKYLGIINEDIDICTNATPEQLSNIFENADFTNQKYGNVNVGSIQITTYRKDEYNDSRYPSKITYVNTLKEDLQRRDFIINTLCIDENGKYIDLLDAIFDINNHIIRTVNEADQKLKEDPLRILRAIRFATLLNFNLDIDLINAIQKYGYLVKKISYVQKKSELDKIFNSSNRELGIKLILEYNLDKYLEIDNLNSIDFNKEIWKQIDINKKYI